VWAGLICDVYTADEEPFPGDPRQVLKRQIAAAADLGYTMMAGVEAEFFLFHRTEDGAPTRRRMMRADTSTWARWTWGRLRAGTS
jgi:glutamine synthetase